MNMPPLAVRPSLSIEAMQGLAGKIARLVQVGDIITLRGEVGAGKTTFARAFIEAIASEPAQVTSPTFNLMQSYDVRLANGKKDTLWHIDLYRLKQVEEIEPLGLRDLLPHIMLIEWPDIVEALMPQERLSISIDFGETVDSRTLMLRGGVSWKGRLEKGSV